MSELLQIAGFSERQLLIVIIERQGLIMSDINALKDQVTQLTAVIVAYQPVLQASLDLTGVAVAKLDELFLLVQQLGSQPSQGQLDELSAAVSSARETIAGDITSLNLRNAAMSEELQKVSLPPPAPETPPTEG